MTSADHPMPEQEPTAGSRLRRILRWLGVAAAGTVAVLLVGSVWLYASWNIDQRAVELTTPLAIPPLASSHLDDQGRRVFDLTAQPGETELLDGQPTDTWGYNGSYLGPTLRAARGEQVLVNVTNKLPESTTTHWHGMESPAVMDGGPHQPIEVGQTWSPTWTIDQPAATTWYHPHPHGSTAKHVYRGLAGMFIVDDPAAAGTLPGTYGVDDVPLIVQDRRFAADGSSEPYNDLVRFTGMLGDTVVVNGTVGPVFEATTELLRLRVLNASPARIYGFTFDDRRQFHQVATDVAPLPEPAAMTSLQLSPGERAEIVVPVQPGDDVVLRSEDVDLDTNVLVTRLSGGHDRFDILRIVAGDTLQPSTPLPKTLSGVGPDQPLPADTTPDRTFSLGDFMINDLTMDHDRIDAYVHSGASEVWEISNDSPQPHNWHVHSARFRVLPASADLPAHHRGWKDTVYLPPGQSVRLAVDFADHPDEEHPYMFHCHLLYHEDNGMMGQFVLTSQAHDRSRGGSDEAVGSDKGGPEDELGDEHGDELGNEHGGGQ